MTENNTGRFVWFELLTSDPEAAIAFYTNVLGWRTQAFAQGSEYTMFASSQGPLAGVTRLPELAKQAGAPPYWQANVEVASVEASVANVKTLGGRVIHAENVPDIGNFAIIADPQGAVISLFTPARPMEAHDSTKSGEFSWHELYTTDHTAAFTFYSAVLGWEQLGEHDMGPMGTYRLWGRNGTQLGGMMNMPAGMKGADGKAPPPAWMHYVTAVDFDATLDRAKRNHATVLNGPHDVPGGMRIVQMLDPQGAAFALVSAPAS
ncbi:VOC family protein [soil metagenome]